MDHAIVELKPEVFEASILTREHAEVIAVAREASLVRNTDGDVESVLTLSRTGSKCIQRDCNGKKRRTVRSVVSGPVNSM